MDVNERRNRLQYLLERQKSKNKKKMSNSLFEECLVALGDEVAIYSQQKTEEIYQKFEEEYPFTTYGRIDWKNKQYQEITIEDLNKNLTDLEERCLIVWSHGEEPVIEAKLVEILKNIDDVTAVSPDVWIYKENDYVIELFHDGMIRKGYKH
ncbi:CDI toxin immunity protein [Paenibacillus sp. URB8-2]|uniref:CDI toxin immunity protein n=1 Tax=Paenibacillus sp. URB8-2 TaxID=2741301 RepID=UPI0015C068EB|nr:hypothetical protein [Paenibacillus sp. URB8-2]BCG60808.1 hypothetical protein PUR_42330 [Paenibacillus sp. URB8-2]